MALDRTAACQSWICSPCCNVMCLWYMCFCAEVFFFCSQTVLQMEHSLGVKFFFSSSLSSCKSCIFLNTLSPVLSTPLSYVCCVCMDRLMANFAGTCTSDNKGLLLLLLLLIGCGALLMFRVMHSLHRVKNSLTFSCILGNHMLFCLIIVSIISILLLCPATCACDRIICSNCSVTTTCPCGVLHIYPTSFAPLSFHSSFSCSPACFCCSLIISSCARICMHSVFSKKLFLAFIFS